MSEIRPNELYMMYIYRDLDIEVDFVMDLFSKFSRRLVI
jgi:hypothetical protein